MLFVEVATPPINLTDWYTVAHLQLFFDSIVLLLCGTRFCDVKNIWKTIHKTLKNKEKFDRAVINSFLN